MRYEAALLLATAILVSCGRQPIDGVAPPVQPVDQSAETPKPVDDRGPILAALDHFRQLPDVWTHGSEAADAVILVASSYQSRSGFISAGQLGADVSDEGWTVPEVARLDMERRTDAGDTLTITEPPEFVRLLNFASDRPGDVLEFSEKHPDARCFVSLWPPGYTADRKQAVVRFMFGPTAHGASAVYLLEFRDGKWQVLKSAIAIYA